MSSWLLSLAGRLAHLLPMGVKRNLYRYPWLAGKIRSGLNRAAPSGLVEMTVASGALSGMRLFLDLHSEKDYWLGTYEPELQAGMLELVKPGMVAYDLGANIGYITLLLARLVGQSGHVTAFEALPSNLERLQTNIRLNDFQQRMTVVPAAVVDHSGTVHFLVGPSGGMGKAQGSAGRNLEYQQVLEVDGIALDDYVRDRPAPQVIKIDIEGGEVLALPGMRRMLAQHRPLVFLELHGEKAADVVWAELTGAGYRISSLAPGYPVVPSLQSLGWKAYVIAFPD